MTDVITETSADAGEAAPQACGWTADDVVQLVRSAARLGLPAEFAINLRDKGVSPAVARDAIIDAKAEADEKIITRHHITGGIDHRDPEQIRTRMVDALCHRIAPGRFELPDHAREFRGCSLADMIAKTQSARGINVRGRTPDEILFRDLGGLMTTSDLPTLLSAVTQKLLATEESADAETPLKRYSRERSAANFHELVSVAIGNSTPLQRVNEAGEFRRGVFVEEGAGFRITTAGLVWGFSRQSLINDDLGALADISDEINLAVAEHEASTFVGLLTANNGAGALAGDGQPLFHSSHNNIAATDAAPSVASLSELRQLLRAQRNVGGHVLAGVRPRAVLVPSQLETLTEQLFSEKLSPAVVESVNPMRLAIEVEPRLPDPLRWYLLGGQALTHAYLQGQRGAQIATRAGFDTDGVEIRARLDFGAAIRSWRLIATNAGAEPAA